MNDTVQNSRTTPEIGIIGLGQIGGNLALQAVEKGLGCCVMGKDVKDRPDLKEAGVDIVTDYSTFVSRLTPPRIVYLSVPAGEKIDTVLEDLLSCLAPGDIVMDGGNSWYRDSIRRAEQLRKKDIRFLDAGTSGGLAGAREGACFMVGGDREAFAIAEPVLKTLALNDDAVIHTGPSGSGHFVKLVHNGIEFGMLQAIGEGYALLKDSDFSLDHAGIFRNWSNGSVIRSWLVDLMEQQLREQGERVESIPAYVEDTGEVNWLVHEAVKREVPTPVIAQSVIELFRSRQQDSPAYRVRPEQSDQAATARLP